jgi:hypothetical protein
MRPAVPEKLHFRSFENFNGFFLCPEQGREQRRTTLQTPCGVLLRCVGDTMSVYVHNNVALQQMAEKNSAPPTFGQPSHFVQPSPNFGQQHGWPQHGIVDRGQPMGLVMPPYTPILSTNQVLPTFASPRPTGTDDEIAELKRDLAQLKADIKKLKPTERQ